MGAFICVPKTLTIKRKIVERENGPEVVFITARRTTCHPCPARSSSLLPSVLFFSVSFPKFSTNTGPAKVGGTTTEPGMDGKSFDVVRRQSVGYYCEFWTM